MSPQHCPSDEWGAFSGTCLPFDAIFVGWWSPSELAL